MRIALIAAPFIAVPPRAYGGTELFVAHLAEGLRERGHDVVVYANGESTVRCPVRWVYAESQWPLRNAADGTLRNLHHTGWAVRDAAGDDFDVIHVNDANALPFTGFTAKPSVLTLHHPHEPELSDFYQAYPDVTFVAISEDQRRRERMPRLRTIHHGLRTTDYRLGNGKREYLCFLGRITPEKGTHNAIEIARRTGIPLKIAGEVQPMFKAYWEREIRPHVDGRLIEYVGEATPDVKNELFPHARALLFPIQWDEPFGLVMIEAMACGTPVLALRRGSVPEVVVDGVSGWTSDSVEELAMRASNLDLEPERCRQYVAQRFSLERMVKDYEALYASAAGAQP